MRLLILLLIVVSSAALPARAETPDGELHRLLTLDEARPWGAVGRVNIAGSAFCTGTLIAPDLVLTAAHCMFFARTGRPVPASRVHFLAGWRKGTHLAHRKVRRYVVHRDYERDSDDKSAQLRADIAVLQLESPVGSNAVVPFERATRPRHGDPVTLVSYARERSEVPSLQEPCFVLGRQGKVLLLSCDVNYGASGAPVFVMSDARPKVAAVISAMTQWRGRKVALSIDLRPALDEVLQELATTDPNFRRVTPGSEIPLQQRVGQPTGPSLRKVSRPPKE